MQFLAVPKSESKFLFLRRSFPERQRTGRGGRMRFLLAGGKEEILGGCTSGGYRSLGRRVENDGKTRGRAVGAAGVQGGIHRSKGTGVCPVKDPPCGGRGVKGRRRGAENSHGGIGGRYIQRINGRPVNGHIGRRILQGGNGHQLRVDRL